MTPSTPLSEAARRTGDSPISDLMARAIAAPDLISLAAGFVDHATLPVGPTAEVVADLLADEVEARRGLQYGVTRGDLHLRKRLVRLVEASEGVAEGTYDAALDRLIVTTGSQQLLYLVAEALIDPGDVVLVESPTYFVFMGVLKARGARVVGVETDEGGLRVDALERTLADLEAAGDLDRVKLIYTISEHSNPTGLSLDADRRRALVEVARAWSKRNRIYVLEDSAYRGLTFEGPEPPSVWSHDDRGDTVILARTFSKTYSPGLKTGYAVVPEPLVDPILNLKGNHDFGSSQFNQQVLERAIASGHYARQVGLLAKTYRRKAGVMLDALAESFAPFGEAVRWTHPRGGLYVWLTLPESIDTGRDGGYFDACIDEGVLYVPGAYAYPTEGVAPTRNQARLTFGVTPEPGLIEGVRRLASALAKLLDGGRRPAAPKSRRESAAVTPG
jgi:2-aminoadipate transaminase